MEKWDERWGTQDVIEKWRVRPKKEIVQLAGTLKHRRYKRVYDLGCAIGRHAVFFAKEGFEVYASDFSEVAVEYCKGWLREENLSATVTVGDMTEIPYDADFFDLVVASGVLYYATSEKMANAINAVYDKLVPSGYFYLTLRSTEHAMFGKGEQLEKNTFFHEKKGSPVHYVDGEEIDELFARFSNVSKTHFTEPKRKNPRKKRGMWEIIAVKPEFR